MKIPKNKIIMILTSFFVALGFLFVNKDAVQAIETVEDPWAQPTFVYGGGLSGEEISQTRGLLNISEGDAAEVEIVGTDVDNYLGLSGTSTSSLISSVLVERTSNGSGVQVNLANPDNITTITEQQYSNAAITAGVEDVNIDVASIRQATGESALTGVYKAFEANGESLDNDRMQVAQEELEVTSDIEQNMNEEQSTQFNQVIINIKQTINNYYEDNGQAPTEEEIRQIIDDLITEYNLTNAVNGDQINNLIVLFQDYANTDAINSEAVQEQLSQLSDRIGQIWNDVEESGILERIWNAIVEFFQNIVGIFNQEA